MKDHCEIIVVLDRSGSMQTAKADHEGGLKSFVEDQKKAAGKAKFTLIQFDSANPCEVIYDGVPIEKVDHIELIPRGGTPLLDAVGLSIAHCEKRIGTDHKGQVIYMIVTDGEENSSREWTKDKVKARIEELEKIDRKFLFLGANIDAFMEAGEMGIKVGSTANFNNNAVGTQSMYSMTSGKLAGSRSMRAGGQSVNCSNASLDYSDDEKLALANAGKPGTPDVDLTVTQTNTGGKS